MKRDEIKPGDVVWWESNGVPQTITVKVVVYGAIITTSGGEPINIIHCHKTKLEALRVLAAECVSEITRAKSRYEKISRQVWKELSRSERTIK